MAVTDALSVALKMLGVAADIYLGRWDGSKYAAEEKPYQPEEKITIAQINEMARLIESKGLDADAKLVGLASKVYRIEKISDLPARLFPDAMKRLEKLPPAVAV